MNPRVTKRVIVVGAGLAGLAAARALAARDFEVIVLEGRDRIGGRCHTENGIDLGAHWIHGTEGNPLTTLARQLAVNTLFVGGDSSYSGGWESMALHAPGERLLTNDEKLASILVADEIWDELDAIRRRLVTARTPDMSLHEAVERVLRGKSLTEEEYSSLDWHMTVLARDDCAAGDRALSFQSWDEGYEVYGYGDSVFMDGYIAITNHLAEGLDIRLEHVVEEVRYDGISGFPVSITTNQGVFTGDAAIVTLPLGVLKAGTVRFEPPLPGHKRAAIARLGVGHLTKVVAYFDSPFWPSDQYVFGYCSHSAANHPTMIINLWKTHQLPALVLMIGGEEGRKIEYWSYEETFDWMMSILIDVFGSRTAQPTEIFRTQWDSDPFSRGSYSYMAVGATPTDIEALAEPIGDRLFFGGEATSRQHWAVAHGAYVSGLREASRIANDASILPARHFTENRRWRDMMRRMTRFFNLVSASVSGLEMKQRLDVLEDSEVFSVVPPSELQILAAMFEPMTFADAQIICRVGERATQVYAIAEGEIEVQLGDGSAILALKRGGVVGEYGMFGAHTRTATLISRGQSRVLALDYHRFHRFLLAFPESSLALFKLTVDRLLNEVNSRRESQLPASPAWDQLDLDIL